MRWLFSWLLLAATSGLPLAAADNASPANINIVVEFSGAGTATTSPFKVRDRWEVRWNARQVVSVAVMSTDGTIVAGAAGVLRGSLFVPLGGRYYLKVSDGTYLPASPAPADNSNAPPSTGTNASPIAPSSPTDTPAPPPAAAASWHLQVVQLGKSVAANQALTVYTPYFIVPDSAITPLAGPPQPPPPELTDDQTHTIVTVKGDNAQGYGFLMRSADGTFVVTHLHLLANNPNIKLFTSSGDAITPLALKGASDRDLARFTIQDNNYTYLPLPADTANPLQAGDQLIIPDISGQIDMLTGRAGHVMGASPERIDFDIPMGAGNAGSPVIHVKSGNVLAILTSEKQVDVSDRLAREWPTNPAPGSSAIIPYFGLRLNGVPTWETYDPARFLQETNFLRQFHEETRCLDSYLNGRKRRSPDDDTAGPPDNKYYLTNSKLRAVQDTYHQQANGADLNQRLEGAQELLFDLQDFANNDLGTLQEMKNLYGYDQTWAQEEIAYRTALKKELDELSNNIVRLDGIARSR